MRTWLKVSGKMAEATATDFQRVLRRAAHATKERIRYNAMTPEVKAAYNAKRREKYMQKKEENKQLMQMNTWEATPEDLQKAVEFAARMERRAASARKNYWKKDAQERKAFNRLAYQKSLMRRQKLAEESDDLPDVVELEPSPKRAKTSAKIELTAEQVKVDSKSKSVKVA
ncbi:hypothetical protein L596_023293 [Steinernema carpocapsae]|uniref:Uncharacterized protein n=1 Tax=Steinernema carpocapsae TaxID=34508 RepID=A0A4U5MD75_STECR|nr:hypothetical protein L596_023293 [Steinernema carpocapsae]